MDNTKMLNYFKGLDKEEQEVMQVATLLGESFLLDHLLELTSIRASKLLNLIRKMANEKLIKIKKGMPEDAYAFIDKKIPETVLQFMEDETKELLLSKIVLFLEKELPTDDKKHLILAELYLKFGGKTNAHYRNIRKAADLLISAHKTKEGLELYEEILNALLETKLQDNNSLEEIVFFVDSVISYAPVAINIRPADTILPILIKAKAISHKLKNNRALAMLELCIGRLFQCQGNSIKASAHYNKGWSLAQGTGDKALLKNASKLAALTLFWQGKMMDAIQIYEHAIGNIEEISSGQEIWSQLMLAYCYGITGRVARGLGLAEAIREMAMAKENLKTQAFADAVIALILLDARQLEKAEVHINNALRIGEIINSDMVLWMVKPCKAYELYSQGNLKKAAEMLESAIKHAKVLGQVQYPTPWIIEIIWSLHKANIDPINGYSFISEINRLKDWPDIYMKGAALRYHALDRRISGSTSEDVEKILDESQRLLEEAGARIELGRTQVELAKIYLDKKHIERAKELANIAYRNLSDANDALFPSELLSLIGEKPKEDRMFHGLQAISKLGGTVDSQSGYESYLGKVLMLLADMFGAERSAIFFIHDEHTTEPLNMAASRNFSIKELEQLIKSPMQNHILTAIQNKEPVVIADTENNTNFQQQSTGEFSVKSIACIPLLVNRKVIGLIYADNRLLSGVFSMGDTIIMDAIATQVALFLKTSTLYRELEGIRSDCEEEHFGTEENESKAEFPEIIGKSPAIRKVLNTLQKISGTDATVLILGETGVGKELIARAIHQHSTRANKAFVVVNVSSLSENLLTNELFGHEKGAFTSAEKSKSGRFELANQGTIFLDEIGDLSLEAQVKLLRVLQEGEFERVGGTQVIHSDFRLITATNRNLIEMVAKGEFRSDLFYRINTFPILIPPLRERKEDIPQLAAYFTKNYAKKTKKNVKKIPNNEMKKLIEYSWPGNVRELEHIVERALILSENDEISTPELREPRSLDSKERGHETELLPLDEIERRHIISVLEHVRWRIRGERGAAEILRLKPSTLEFRIKKLKIRQ